MENCKFKPGEKVSDSRYGKGVVILVDEDCFYPVRVRFEKKSRGGGYITRSYTEDGMVYYGDGAMPILKHEPSIVEKFFEYVLNKLDRLERLINWKMYIAGKELQAAQIIADNERIKREIQTKQSNTDETQPL
jgi:hypothetical protein